MAGDARRAYVRSPALEALRLCSGPAWYLRGAHLEAYKWVHHGEGEAAWRFCLCARTETLATGSNLRRWGLARTRACPLCPDVLPVAGLPAGRAEAVLDVSVGGENTEHAPVEARPRLRPGGGGNPQPTYKCRHVPQGCQPD
eukprot:gnl/Chilomastix_cuspidata/4623.p4 GENE.gnl/Chilomastix_cuspidata/4623~~gnl/Chilomastix_cuspidata/4623.p4  ORF type:complete len:142 (-),score=37.94 gnl/Chilomastix_cuspidata/4623:595-1020(-)